MIAFDIIRDDNIKALAERFATEQLTPMLVKAGQAAGVAAESFVSEYPPQRKAPLPYFYTRTRKDGTTYKSKFKTMKQQRYVMAMVAKRKIPYSRTGTLGRSITSAAIPDFKGSVIVAIGTNVSYAPYVIGFEQQSNYHKGNWIPLQMDITSNIDAIVKVAQDVFSRELMGG